MTTIALILAAVALLVSLICLAALVEMFRNLEDLQKHVEYNDTPKQIPEATNSLIGQLPSTHGLQDLDQSSGVVLLLSPKCHTCGRIAEELAKGLPEALMMVVVSGTDEATAYQWLAATGLAADDVTLDDDYQIVRSLSLFATPSALRIFEGQITGVWSIPSVRALDSFLNEELAPASAPTPIQPKDLRGERYAKAG